MGICNSKTSDKYRERKKSEYKGPQIALNGSPVKVFADVINEIQAFGESLQSIQEFWDVRTIYCVHAHAYHMYTQVHSD